MVTVNECIALHHGGSDKARTVNLLIYSQVSCHRNYSANLEYGVISEKKCVGNVVLR